MTSALCSQAEVGLVTSRRWCCRRRFKFKTGFVARSCFTVQRHTDILYSYRTLSERLLLVCSYGRNVRAVRAQATTLSSTAVESAQTRLRTLELPHALNARLGALAKPAEPEPVPESELLAYGVTAEFREFIRSLTYSTFRDFPQDALPADTQARTRAPGSLSC